MKFQNIAIFLLLKLLLELDCKGQILLLNSQFQRHDFRTVIDNYIVRPKDYIGVNTFSIFYQMKISSRLNLGLGFGSEISTTPAGLKSTLVLSTNNIQNDISINKYVKNLLFIPLDYILPLNNKFHFGVQGLLGIGVHRRYNDTKIRPVKSDIHIAKNFYNDFEVFPFLRMNFENINIDLGYRLFHFKNVDNSIFYKEFYDKWETVVDTKVYDMSIDFYNPFKLNLAIGYTFKNK